MRRMLLPIGLVLACGAAAASSAPRERMTDAEKFAKATAGLVPGRAQDCLPSREPSTGLSAVGSRLIYRVNRGLVYVNETTGGCENVARDDILVTESYQGRLCRGDIARTVSRTAPRFTTGSCALGPFIPYRKP